MLQNARRFGPLMLVMFLVGAQEVVASPMMVPMAESFGVAPGNIAWLLAAYALVYAVLGPFLGPLSDRFGRKQVMVPALVTFAATAFGVSVAPSFQVALACSAVGGLAAAAMAPNVFAIVGDEVGEARRPAVMGLALLGLTIGLVMTPAMAGWFAANTAWQDSYRAIAVLALLAALAIATRQLRPRPQTAPRGSLLAMLAAGARLPGIPPRLAGSLLWLGIPVGLSTVLGEVIRRRYGLPVEQLGLMVAGFGAFSILGNLLVPLTARIVGNPHLMIQLGIAGTTVAIAFLMFGPVMPVPGLVATIGLWALSLGIAGPNHQSVLAGLSGAQRGTVAAISNSLLNLGIMITATLAAMLFDGWGTAPVGIAVLCALMAGLAAQLHARRREKGTPEAASA
jgi:predicted MFS family arabinose efflux permease